MPNATVGFDELLGRVRHLADGVDAIGRSRDALTRRVLSVALLISAVLILGIGITSSFIDSGTRVRSLAPILVWAPATLILAARFVRRGITSLRLGWWSSLTVVLVVWTVAVNGSIGLILTLCLLPTWHVVHQPDIALRLSAGTFLGALGAVILTEAPVDLQVTLRLFAAYAVLVILLQVIMRHLARVSSAAELVAQEALQEVARLDAQVQRATQRFEAERFLDPEVGVLTAAGLEHWAMAGEPMEDDPKGGGTRSRSTGAPRLLIAVRFCRWTEVDLAQSLPERPLLSRAVGDRLRKVFGPAATIARMGVSEFTIVIAQATDEQADVQQATAFLSELAQPLSVGTRHVLLQPVMGICRSRDESMPILERLKCAEIAREMGSRHQLERPIFFDPSMREQVADRVAFAARIAQGLAAGEFALYYQPIIDVATGRCCKAEGLLRWHHPERGVLAPAAFLGVVEEHGLAVPLLTWTTARACADLKRLRETLDPEFRVALNVSPEILVGGAGLEQLESQLSRATLPRDALVLEITETVLVSPSRDFIAALERLRALGARIAIDDFGTGHSTLARLAELPVDILKVDRLLVTGIDRRPRQATILRSVIALARDLGLRVTVEGVETEAEAQMVGAAGCQEIQGFLHSPAVPLERLPEVIQHIEGDHTASSVSVSF